MVNSQVDSKNRNRLSIRYVGGPTTFLEVGSLRLLIDPTFDPPGDHQVGSRVLVKTSHPAVPPGGSRGGRRGSPLSRPAS